MADYLRTGNVTWLSRLTDGRIMCCLCYNYFHKRDLADLPGGLKEDVCKPCKTIEESGFAA